MDQMQIIMLVAQGLFAGLLGLVTWLGQRQIKRLDDLEKNMSQAAAHLTLVDERIENSNVRLGRTEDEVDKAEGSAQEALSKAKQVESDVDKVIRAIDRLPTLDNFRAVVREETSELKQDVKELQKRIARLEGANPPPGPYTR